MVRILDIAKVCGIDTKTVKETLKENPNIKISRELKDKIFKTARNLGYDFRKLKIGKQLYHRKSILTELISTIESNQNWNREEILRYLKQALDMIGRVHNRAFYDEYGEEH